MTRLTSGRRSGFTLTELIVVIAIIVVLTAILLPVLSQVRKNARKVECLSHLHYISIAMKLYISDHSGYFPNWCATNPDPNNPPSNKNAPNPSVVTWDTVLADYTEKPGAGSTTLPAWQTLLTCPDWPRGPWLSYPSMVTDLGPASGSYPAATPETARAYALARQTQQIKGTSFYGGYVNLIPNPSQTVMIFEKGANLPGSWGDALGENVNQSHGTAADTSSGYTPVPFHFNGKNVMFVDGSVKWCQQTATPSAAPSNVYGGDPFGWNPVGSNGAGACERWGAAPAGDWPPLS